MANRVITPETYDLMVRAYRERPGVHSHAARMANCDVRMARRGWEEGWPNRPFAVAIKDFLANERLMARARAAELEEQRYREKLAMQEKASAEAAETLAHEAKNMHMAVMDTQLALGMLGSQSMANAISKLVKRIESAAAEADKIGVGTCAKIVTSWTAALCKLTAANRENVATERLRKGEPTEVLGVKVEQIELTREEALRELDDMRALLGAEGAGDGDGEETLQ